MKRFPVLGILLLVPAVALLVLVGCGDGKKTTTPAPTTTPGGDNKGAKEKIKGEPKGIVKGKVTFKGDVPALEDHPDMQAPKAADKDFCLKAGGIHVKKQTWLVKDKGVANVVISLEPPDGKEYDLNDAAKKWHKENPVEMDQPHCQYVPHVRAVYADVQELIVSNTAKVTHNVKFVGLKNNDDFDKPMKPGGDPIKFKFKHEAKAINFVCSIHGWMNAKVVTFQHPYFAVTKDDGSFEIKNVPIGEDLVIYMWHESMEKKASKGTKKFVEGPNSLELEISK